jgi:microcystin degradation protein MlrC
MKKRVLIAGLFHETHTFVERRTEVGDFAVRREMAMMKARGDGSPLDGVLEVAEACAWEVVPSIDMRAAPSGMVTDEAVEFFWTYLREAATRALRDGIGAIFLVLHGAMVSESIEDVEGEILGRIRALPGAAAIPVFGVYDLHANFSPVMAERSNCLVAYRENPHTDARQAAVEAARLLERCLSGGGVPRSWYRHASIVWPPTGTGTADEPMKSLEGVARRSEGGEVWAVNVNAGFSFADTRYTGVSFSVSGTCSEERAGEILDALCREAWERRGEGCASEEPVETVVERILPVKEGPVILVEPSDNIGGGAPGDGTGLLRVLVKRRVEGAVVVINDPAAAAAAIRAGVGATVHLEIGGRGSRMDPGPLPLDVDVVSTSDGRFDLEDLQSHLASMRGRHIEMGPCAVVHHDGVTILLTSVAIPPFDLGQLRSQGIEPEKAKIIGVKAAVAHRRAYDPIAQAMYWVATPGPCSSRLEDFSFLRLERPVFPLDSIEQPRPCIRK